MDVRAAASGHVDEKIVVSAKYRRSILHRWMFGLQSVDMWTKKQYLQLKYKLKLLFFRPLVHFPTA